MFRKTLALLFATIMAVTLVACGNSLSEGEKSSMSDSAEAQEETEAESPESNATQEETESASPESTAVQEKTDSDNSTTESADTTISLGNVPNTLAEDKDALIANNTDKFEQKTYSDSDTGLSITYNIYLPEEYNTSEAYPMVVFIGDSSCAGSDATVSLTQGRGGLVWATDEWQSVYPTIVVVPTYPETILDDHGSYTTTEYVELTKRFIDNMSGEYAVDTDRIYGTGQSMGCMTTLILASKYPELYAACMFVDGQWDISTLSGLEDQTFVYFAAEDDTNAWNGAQEVMDMFDADSVSYKYAQWDGNCTVDELSAEAQELFVSDENRYFISWETGTIEPKSGGMSGLSVESDSGFEGTDGTNEKPSEGFGGPNGNSEKPSGGFGGPSGADGSPSMNGDFSGGTDSSAYHMASFDYAYNCVAVMEWLFQQSR